MPKPTATFNNLATAGYYSQLTGLLAGFAFAGLVLVFTHEVKRLRSGDSAETTIYNVERTLLLLFSSFVGLVLTSLGYAVIAGDAASNVRASVEHTFGGAAFAFAGLTLFLALLEMFRPLAPQVEVFARRIVGIAGPFVALFYVGAGVLDAADESKKSLQRVLIAVAVCFAVQLAATAIALRLKPRILQMRVYIAVAWIAMSAAFVGSAAIPLLGALAPGPDTAIPFWPVWLALGFTTVGGSLFAVYCRLSRPARI